MPALPWHWLDIVTVSIRPIGVYEKVPKIPKQLPEVFLLEGPQNTVSAR